MDDNVIKFPGTATAESKDNYFRWEAKVIAPINVPLEEQSVMESKLRNAMFEILVEHDKSPLGETARKLKASINKLEKQGNRTNLIMAGVVGFFIGTQVGLMVMEYAMKQDWCAASKISDRQSCAEAWDQLTRSNQTTTKE